MIARNPPTNIKPPAISDEIQVLTPDIYLLMKFCMILIFN